MIQLIQAFCSLFYRSKQWSKWEHVYYFMIVDSLFSGNVKTYELLKSTELRTGMVRYTKVFVAKANCDLNSQLNQINL